MRKALAAAAALFLYVPAVAHAGTVEVVANDEPHFGDYVQFTAAAGETNHVTVVRSMRKLRVRDDGAPLEVGEGCDRTSPNEALCENTDFFEVALGDGDDTLTAARGYISGGAGNDTITAKGTLDGGPGDDTLTGGPHRDDLSGGGGEDTLYGRGGDDLLDDGDRDGAPVGPDRLDGGTGRDRAYVSRARPITIDLRHAGGQGEAGEDDTYVGIEDVLTSGPVARLTGNAGANELALNEGRNARIDGRGGADVISTSGGAPRAVRGGAGDDRVEVERSANLACGAGRDFLSSPAVTQLVPDDCESVDFGDFNVIYDLRRHLTSLRAPIVMVRGGFCPYDGRSGCQTVWAARRVSGTGPLVAKRVQRWRLGHYGRRVPLRLTSYGRRLISRRNSLRLTLGRMSRHGFHADFVADFSLTEP